MREFEKSPLVEGLLAMHLPRWEELPGLDLYMDQLVNYINGAYSPATDPSELPLTRSMVNNYVKQKIIPAPVNKRYQRQHLALLILIYALKKVFSLPECVELIRLVVPGGVLHPRDYNRSCDALEAALRQVFEAGEEKLSGDPVLDRAAQTWAGKLYLQKYMEYMSKGKNVPY